MSGLKRAGIEPLINETAYLPECNIAICGAQIDRAYFRHFRRTPHGDVLSVKAFGNAGWGKSFNC